MDSPSSSLRLVCTALALIVGASQSGADSIDLSHAFPRVDVAAPVVIHTLDAKAGDRGTREGDRRRVNRLHASVLFAVGSGLVAYWSKREADEAYEAYLASASVRRQRKLFQRAERYDRIAGAAFLGMEAGLALTIYLAVFAPEDNSP